MSEVRGLVQMLSQQIGQTYSERCNVVRFGDSRCGVNVATVTVSAVVATVTDRRHLTLTYAPTLAAAFAVRGGVLTFTSGANEDFSREVKRIVQTGSSVAVELWDETPDDAVATDTVTLQAGCDRRYTTCRNVYENVINFRGYGVMIPGALAMMAGVNAVQDCTLRIPEDTSSP